MSRTDRAMIVPPRFEAKSLNEVPLRGIDINLRRATGNQFESHAQLFACYEMLYEKAHAQQTAPQQIPQITNTPPPERAAHSPGKEKTETEATQRVEIIETGSIGGSKAHVPNPCDTTPPVMRTVREIFGNDIKNIESSEVLGIIAELELPCWSENHFPNVPRVESYMFENMDTFKSAVISIALNRNLMIVGPTGCGKSTFLEQMAARMGRPMYRIPFDGEIRRQEVIGHYVQRNGGGSHTEWQPGMLEKAMQWPSIVCFDEYDRGDPDLIFSVHEALERRPLRLLEEGGVIVPRHPHLTLTATANTKGTGDSMGVYAEKSQMSEASRSRFSAWSDHTYLSIAAETALLTRRHPSLPKSLINDVTKIAADARNSFLAGHIRTAISTRQTIDIVDDMALTLDLLKKGSQSRAETAIKHYVGDIMRRYILARAADSTDEQSLDQVIKNVRTIT